MMKWNILIALTVLANPTIIHAQAVPELSFFEQLQAASSSTTPMPEGGAPQLVFAENVGKSAQDSEEEASYWRHVLIGGGTGLLAGFLIGWIWDHDRDFAEPANSNGLLDPTSKWYYRIKGSLIGAGSGVAIGSIIYIGGR